MSNDVIAIDPKDAKGKFADIAIGVVSDIGMQLMPTNFGEVASFAQMMAKSGPMLRPQFRENPGACMAIVMQAMRWGGLDPWQVANKAFFVNETLCYEAQLIAAVIIKIAPIKDRPSYQFEGEGQTRRCIVSVTTRSGQAIEQASPRIDQIKTKNSPLWTSDPDQQLGYYTIRAMARRHFPDIILGAYDRDEILDLVPVVDRRTPQEALREKLAATTAATGGAVVGDGFVGSEAHAAAQGSPQASESAGGLQPAGATTEASEQPPAEPEQATGQDQDAGGGDEPGWSELLDDAQTCFTACKTVEEIEENVAIMAEPGGWYRRAPDDVQKLAMGFVDVARHRVAKATAEAEEARQAAEKAEREAEAAAEREAEERVNGAGAPAPLETVEEHPALADCRRAAAEGVRKLKLACGKVAEDVYAAHVAPHRKELDAIAKQADKERL